MNRAIRFITSCLLVFFVAGCETGPERVPMDWYVASGKNGCNIGKLSTCVSKVYGCAGEKYPANNPYVIDGMYWLRKENPKCDEQFRACAAKACAVTDEEAERIADRKREEERQRRRNEQRVSDTIKEGFETINKAITEALE